MLLAIGLCLADLPARAQATPDEVPLEDVLEVVVIDRELLAFDARNGGQRTLPLRLAERVLWTGSRGRVGVALTDQRILAVSTDSAAWQVESRQRGEALPDRALLGDRVGLILTSVRALGFDGGSGNLVESRLGLREQVLDARSGANVAVVVTDRRALGLSPLVGGFFETPILLAERIESLTAGANLASITTDRRILIFRATTGSWEERNRPLN